MAIIDTRGLVLVQVGWQDICTKFHRVHPISCSNCIESDIQLTHGIADGEFKLYKCKNNMWDMATPIIIGGEHKGNLFLGQFFYDSETFDHELFRKQAGKYNFDEQEYMDALERAPRLNKQKLEYAKAFFLNLSHSISQLSYSNIKLARTMTQQKNVEAELREKEELLSKAHEIAHLGSWSLDLIENKLTWSDEIYRIFGLQRKEFEATYEGFLDAIHPEDREAVNFAYTHSLHEGNNNYEIEHRIIRKHTGELRYVEEKCEHIRNASGKVLRSVGMVHDITERRQSIEVITENERLLRESQTIAHIGSYSADLKTKTWKVSPEIYEIFGIDKTYPNTIESWLGSIHPEFRKKLRNDLFKGIKGEKIFEHEYKIIRIKDKVERWVYGYGEFEYDEHQHQLRLIGTIQDITERKIKEETLRKFNLTLTALSKSSQAMLQSTNETDYLKQVCKIVTEDTDFAMVWIGYAEDDESKTVRPVASAGFNDDYLNSIIVSWADNKFGRGPTGVAIRTGEMFICKNMLTDSTFEPWREQALMYGFASSIVFPLKDGDKVFGAFTIYSKKPDSFLDVEIKLLAELANDLAQGITTIRLRAAHQLAEEALIKSHAELEVLVKERTSELIKTNEALKITEEKYRTVSDFATNWEFWIAPGDQMIYCSPSCERITGYTSTEFLVNPQLLFDIIHHDDLPEYLEHREQEKLSSKCDHEIQYRIFKKDGSVRWIGHFCRPVYDESGVFKGTRGSNKDITARKKMEELLTTSNQKYKMLSENITDGIFICKNGRFEYVNKAIYDIFGYEEHELERMKLTQLVASDNQKLEKILYSNDLVNRSCNIELECLKKDLSIVFVEILLNYVSKDKMVYGVIHDITDKKELQKNMVKAIIQTEEKERAHFSKELHDGLGPLLSTIKLYLQWSERPNSNKSREEIIGKAAEILEEALGTVKEISTKLSPHLLTNYGLSSAIKSFVEKLNATAAYDIVFESNTDRRIGSEIEASLYRAIIECINNTLKYANAKSIYINLHDTGSQIQLEYRDDGIGFNLKETLAKQKGLGLFNLQNRLHTMGGKVDLFSEPGKGVEYLFVVNV